MLFMSEVWSQHEGMQETTKLSSIRHHQSICPRDLPKKNEKQAEDNSTNNPSTSNQLKVNQNLTTTTNLNSARVLLQISTTFAYSNYDATAIPVRVLMDCGSQKSYVTNNLKKKLGLQPKKRKH